MAAGGIEVAGRRLTRAVAVVNVASGRVGPQAPARLSELLADAGLEAEIAAPAAADLQATLKRAVAEEPDLLIILAGDGTARAAASLCGPATPLLAPLPGGTMNILPRALYGERDWETALVEALDHGVVRSIAGGRIEDEAFFVAALLGAPALWAEAREAARDGRFALAVRRAERALRRAFTGRLRFQLESGPPERTEALALITPLISRALSADEPALEAAALDPAGALDAFRLAASYVAGDWRHDPAVTTRRCRLGQVWAAGRIPAILDGEPKRLERAARIRFQPRAFQALALELPPAPDQAAELEA